MKAPMQWDHVRFAELFKYDPRSAFEYRLETLGDPIPEQWLTDEEKGEKKELTKKDLMNMLREAGVTFSPAATEDKLKQKAEEAGLL